jgi:hypothetical protein
VKQQIVAVVSLLLIAVAFKQHLRLPSCLPSAVVTDPLSAKIVFGNTAYTVAVALNASYLPNLIYNDKIHSTVLLKKISLNTMYYSLHPLYNVGAVCYY